MDSAGADGANQYGTLLRGDVQTNLLKLKQQKNVFGLSVRSELYGPGNGRIGEEIAGIHDSFRDGAEVGGDADYRNQRYRDNFKSSQGEVTEFSEREETLESIASRDGDSFAKGDPAGATNLEEIKEDEQAGRLFEGRGSLAERTLTGMGNARMAGSMFQKREGPSLQVINQNLLTSVPRRGKMIET